MTPNLADVARELYELTPQEFTAARNARAKDAAGEKELAADIRRLPKPSASAWAVNALVRHLGAEIEQLLSLGEALRDAQRDLDRAALGELTRQRRQLLGALVTEATALSASLGHRIAPSAAEEVEQTLQAALADTDAAAAVLSGMLVRPLASVGFEPVDLDGAVAADGTGSLTHTRKADAQERSAETDPAGSPQGAGKQRSGRDRKGTPDAGVRGPGVGRDESIERERQATREATDESEKQVDEADAALRELDERAGYLERRRDDLAVELDDLKQQIDEVETDIAALDREARALDRDRDKAERAALQARRAHAMARERLEQLG